MKFIWYTALIRAVPESIGLVLLTLALVKERTSFSNLIKAGLLCGLASFTMRIMPIKFGIHAIISAVLQAFIMSSICDIKIHKIFKGLLICVFIEGALEVITFLSMEDIVGLSPEAVHSTPMGTILSGLPSMIMLYVIAFLVNRFNSKFRANKEGSNNVY